MVLLSSRLLSFFATFIFAFAILYFNSLSSFLYLIMLYMLYMLWAKGLGTPTYAIEVSFVSLKTNPNVSVYIRVKTKLELGFRDLVYVVTSLQGPTRGNQFVRPNELYIWATLHLCLYLPLFFQNISKHFHQSPDQTQIPCLFTRSGPKNNKMI